MTAKKNRRKWSQTVETTYNCQDCETAIVIRGASASPPLTCAVCGGTELKKGSALRITVDVLVEELS